MGDSDNSLSIVMYPWFAMGHLTAFLHLSNKLAQKGHQISFLLPTKTQSKLEQFNLHPDLIKFIPLRVPKVEALPPDAETTSDIQSSLLPLLRLALDNTKPIIDSLLKEIKPHFVFFDFQHWLPSIARPLGIKCVHFCIISPATIGYSTIREQQQIVTDARDLMKAPPAYPSSSVKLRTHEARGLFFMRTLQEIGSGMSFTRRVFVSMADSDAIGFKTCREMEGPFCEFLENEFKKPIILAGPVVPEPPTSSLEEQWANWLSGFKAKTVIFCAFGSECRLKLDQFQELLLGLELTGFPFFAALKPPVGAETIEEALPQGFKERIEGKLGIVHGGWVQQQLILAHPSVGCFVTHCGSGSLSEVLVNECQIVLLPHVGDQVINARVMGGDLKVGVEVEKGDEDGLFTKEGVCKAIRLVMDENSEIGKEVRANHGKWREFLLSKGLETSYIDEFVLKLRGLLEINSE